MTLYRVSFRNPDDDGHLGYEWTRSLAEAQGVAIARGYLHARRVEDGGAYIEAIDVTPTAAGILAALNKYADHPNNG